MNNHYTYETQKRISDVKVNDCVNEEVEVAKSTGEKCNRCWNYVDHLDGDICDRCHNIINN